MFAKTGRPISKVSVQTFITQELENTSLVSCLTTDYQERFLFKT